jgi:alpha,alpha-trehalose-phosphate synthase [UDP-forming]
VTERLVIVSNRLPIVLSKRVGAWRATPASGGLTSALAPVLQRRGGLWIGWPGTTDPADLSGPLADATRRAGYALRAVPLSRDEMRGFYHGFSNEVLWPLFHDLQSRCRFDPTYWKTYQEVNRRFAQAAAAELRADDFVWVHDYHLVTMGRELRALGVSQRLVFFLHTPFPPPDIFEKLPWRSQILSALLDYDLLGFQTGRDLRNFLQCARRLAPEASVDRRDGLATVRSGGRRAHADAFPIGIDARAYAADAASPEVTREVRRIAERLPGRLLFLGVDRLDYTKAIPERFDAFANALLRHPDLLGRATLIQIVVPSRDMIGEYQTLKTEIERRVGEINGRFTIPGYVPIHYMYRSLGRTELLGFYRAARAAIVTPLKDGMNLVSKEYCAANIEGDGVLILSEFAGAAQELGRHALLVNPYDIEGMADAIARAMSMPEGERRARMRRLRSIVRRNDVFAWVDSILGAAGRLEPAEPAPTNLLRRSDDPAKIP